MRRDRIERSWRSFASKSTPVADSIDRWKRVWVRASASASARMSANYTYKKRRPRDGEKERIQSGQSACARACRHRHVAHTCSGFSWSRSHSRRRSLRDVPDTRVHSHERARRGATRTKVPRRNKRESWWLPFGYTFNRWSRDTRDAIFTSARLQRP